MNGRFGTLTKSPYPDLILGLVSQDVFIVRVDYFPIPKAATIDSFHHRDPRLFGPPPSPRFVGRDESLDPQCSVAILRDVKRGR